MLSIIEVEYRTDTGASGRLELPTRLENLPPRTAVTLSVRIAEPAGKNLLVGSVSSPMKVFLDEELALECGLLCGATIFQPP